MSRGKTSKRGKGRVYTFLDGSTKRRGVGKSGAARFAADNDGASEGTREPSTAEIASYGGDFLALPLQNGVVPNPDEIMANIAPSKLGQYSKLGTDPYQLHRIMRTTDQKYKSLARTRKNGVLSKEWNVVPNQNDPDQERAVEIADFINAALSHLDNFHADLDALLDAIFLGYSVSEIMWQQREVRYGDGLARLAWIPGELRSRRQGRFGFAADGSLRYQESAGKFIEVPAWKFVVHTHAKEHEAPQGTAECTEVFWTWFVKHHFGKWWAIFGEKFGMPTAVAKYPQNWNDEQKRKLKAVLKAFQTEYGIVIPQNASIDFVEAQRYGTVNVYQAFMEWADKGMSEALTGQSLATGQGEGGTGSFAQSQTHAEVKHEYVVADAKELMATLQTQLINPMVVVNFGEDVPAPQFVLDYEARNLAGDLEIDAKLVNEIGLALPVNYFYEKYGRPMPGEDDEVVAGRKVSAPAFGASPFGGGGVADEDSTQRREDTKEKPKKEKPAEEPAEDELEEEKAEKHSVNGAARAGRRDACAPRTFAVTPEAESEADRRKREFDGVLEKLAEEGSAIFGALGAEILGEAESAADLSDLRERVQAIAAKGEARQELTGALVKAKVNGYLVAAAQAWGHAQRVLEEEADDAGTDQHGLTRTDTDGHGQKLRRQDANATGSGALRAKMGKTGRNAYPTLMSLDFLADYEPLDPQEALEWFENLTPLTKPELEELPREAAGSSFTVADIETKGVLDKVKDLIGKFLGNGGTTKDFVEEYQETRKEMGLDYTENHKAEQLFRTETGRAYGAGRNRSLRDPEVKDAFPLWQYVAIMDDRTRDEHRALNGFVAAPDDPVWLTKTPPWDHNCRCDIIPLTKRAIEKRGIEEKGTVTMPDGSEVDPRTWPTGPGFRGLGF